MLCPLASLSYTRLGGKGEEENIWTDAWGSIHTQTCILIGFVGFAMGIFIKGFESSFFPVVFLHTNMRGKLGRRNKFKIAYSWKKMNKISLVLFCYEISRNGDTVCIDFCLGVQAPPLMEHCAENPGIFQICREHCLSHRSIKLPIVIYSSKLW